MRDVVWWKGPIPRELALAATAGLVFAVSPFTPNERAPSAAGGFVLGLALLAWRLRRSSPVWREPIVAAPWLRRGPLLGAGSLLLCLAAFAPTLQWMYREWTVSVWVNDHGLFMPFVMAWLAHGKLRDYAGEPEESSAWGFLPLTAGLALSVLDANARSRYLAAVGLLLALAGLSLLLLGRRRTWAIRMPLLLGLLLLPVPFSLVAPLGLRTFTAQGVLQLLHLLGLSALREGTLIHMPPAHNFVVADACSGANTLWASLAMALVLAVTSPVAWRRAALMIFAPLLAISANVLRVTLLVLLTSWLGTELLDTPIHEATGVATFLGVLGPLILIAYSRLPGGAR
jgi:exosortase